MFTGHCVLTTETVVRAYQIQYPDLIFTITLEGVLPLRYGVYTISWEGCVEDASEARVTIQVDVCEDVEPEIPFRFRVINGSSGNGEILDLEQVNPTLGKIEFCAPFGSSCLVDPYLV